jgi:hypothetical protein
MCVADGRSALVSRTAFLGVLAAAAVPLVAGSAAAEAADVASAGTPFPEPHGPLTPGNAAAAMLARNSNLAAASYARVEALLASIGDSSLHAALLDAIRNPQALYASKHPTPSSRLAVRDELARAGFVAADAPVGGVFPAGTEPAALVAIQPFWAAPGSSRGSHHAYPGGLALHESFNATMAQGYASTYDLHYFGGRPVVSRDTVVAAALYHDIMKTVVFGWNDDGTLYDELTIAGTGAHHILSGAEAITRGHGARFVVTLLSAHAAPSLGDEAKVIAWSRAAAIVAGVDPVDYGLLRRDGSGYALAADPVPLEAFINHLSDHDYVVSIHAMRVVSARLEQRWAQITELAYLAPTFDWYRAMLLTRTSALTLYTTLAQYGDAAFESAIVRTEMQLTPLRV